MKLSWRARFLANRNSVQRGDRPLLNSKPCSPSSQPESNHHISAVLRAAEMVKARFLCKVQDMSLRVCRTYIAGLISLTTIASMPLIVTVLSVTEAIASKQSSPPLAQLSNETGTTTASALDQPATQATCPTEQGAALVSTSDGLSQLVHWAVRPEASLDSLIDTVGPALAAQLSARPFPQIHDRARLAKVPVIMYHDILPKKEVFFDVTPAEFEADLKLIQQKGLTPISLDQLVAHLSTGMPLPEKPILLTFDDGYSGHYRYVYPLLKRYGYPGVFAIYTAKVGTNQGRSSLTWDELKEMAADPLVTIAAHSITHPPDLGELDGDRLRREVVESKRILEERLGITINDFVYPAGKYNAQVENWVKLAGYRSALTMDDKANRFAGESKSLLSIDRVGQSALEDVIKQAYGGPPLPPLGSQFNFTAPIQLNRVTLQDTPLLLISGGRPVTIHANSRYQVPEIIANTRAVAAVDGGFFSLKYLDSNVMIGPVLSHNTGKFVPGNASENPRLNGRPLVLISPDSVKFAPFNADRHNTLSGIQAEESDVTDAFVAAAWLVKDSQPQPNAAFGDLFDFNIARHRAFWGVNQSGQAVIGVSAEPIGSVDLGKLLAQAGLRDAVMLDSGASTSLAYQGESLVGYTPRPVPHVVALLPPEPTTTTASCTTLVSQRQTKE
jgi:poly-beta-1,6-N-acetyl-D-glucosamine N-deacetylase